MRLGYFTMPVHPMHRDWRDRLREDREAVILADKLGFHDAFIGEHLSDACERVTNSMMFLASVAFETRNIRLGTGTSNLSQMHPTLIAGQAAMLDHLSDGRFILGISPGSLTTDAEALGILDQDRNKMFAEAIDVILEIWSREAPYAIDLPDNRYKVPPPAPRRLNWASAICPSHCSNRGRRSSARCCRRSRPASSPWGGATSTRCRRTFCCRNG